MSCVHTKAQLKQVFPGGAPPQGFGVEKWRGQLLEQTKEMIRKGNAVVQPRHEGYHHDAVMDVGISAGAAARPQHDDQIQKKVAQRKGYDVLLQRKTKTRTAAHHHVLSVKPVERKLGHPEPHRAQNNQGMKGGQYLPESRDWSQGEGKRQASTGCAANCVREIALCFNYQWVALPTSLPPIH
jgi:hypothetical protein